jgi:DNA invertase Pin-like site-specific DNA recombinase
VVVDQSIDTTTPAGRFLFHSLAAVAEFERDLIRERVSAGMRAARRRGKRVGRPRAISVEGLERVRRLHAAGHSQRQIAAALQASKGSVARAIAALRAAVTAA